MAVMALKWADNIPVSTEISMATPEVTAISLASSADLPVAAMGTISMAVITKDNMYSHNMANVGVPVQMKFTEVNTEAVVTADRLCVAETGSQVAEVVTTAAGWVVAKTTTI